MNTQAPAQKYPECDKLFHASDESQKLGEFMEWLESKGIWLAEWMKRPSGMEELVPTDKSRERILADYFGIDLKKVEEERQAMLAEIRNKQ